MRCQRDDSRCLLGILCRTCSELIAFDSRPFHTYGSGTANLRPGAIRCTHGHSHSTFPRDFGLFFCKTPITDATMRENCMSRQATNLR